MIDVTEHLKLAQYMMNKYYHKYSHMYEYEDFKQVIYLGLVKAANNFNEDLEFKFSTYAVKTIFGEIMRFVQDDKKYNASRGIPHGFKILSYESENETGCLKNRIGDDDFEEEMISRISFDELAEDLSEKEKKVFRLYFIGDFTQANIAKMLNTSPVQVSRMKSKILKKLKNALEINVIRQVSV